MAELAPRVMCIQCGREIHGQAVEVPVNSRLTATAHEECAGDQ